MPGPIPKNPAIRQRSNKTSTHAVLSPEKGRKARVPRLPERADGQEWHKLTLAWWRDTWRSPMAAEYLQADTHGLYILAVLVDEFWHSPTKELAGEIRLQRQCYGLTPVDRRRLQWEVERVEEVTERRRTVASPPEGQPALPLPAPTPEHRGYEDPRKVLRIVNG